MQTDISQSPIQTSPSSLSTPFTIFFTPSPSLSPTPKAAHPPYCESCQTTKQVIILTTTTTTSTTITSTTTTTSTTIT